MKKIRRSPFKSTTSARRRRFSPLILIGAGASLIVALVGTAVFVLPRIGSRADTLNLNCALVVPQNPLSATGLATPYQFTAANPDNGPCNENNPLQASFVQGAVIDPATGQISIYNPLVIDQGTKPAIMPMVPQLPANAVVALWFGSNANTLTLQDTNGSLMQGNCVNGLENSIFGQFSYCNAPAFFQAANAAIQAGKLKVPALGTSKDGMICPTTRDFSIVDQDQSDNVTTSYIVTASGQTAQDTPANTAALQGQSVAKNGSDERLLTLVDAAIGCTPWMVPDLASVGQAQMVTGLPLNELQAAADQGAPVALVPTRDPMVLVNNNVNLDKVNAYRVGVDQQVAQSLGAASTRQYCQNLVNVGPARLLLDAPFTEVAAPADPAVGNTLFTFLAARYVASYTMLNCSQFLGTPDPISVKTDKNGVAIDATINGKSLSTAFNCSVNGTIIVGCNGSATINGQSCTFGWDKKAHQLDVTCPAQQQ